MFMGGSFSGQDGSFTHCLRGFESLTAYQFHLAVAQLGSASDLGSEGRWFDSSLSDHFSAGVSSEVERSVVIREAEVRVLTLVPTARSSMAEHPADNRATVVQLHSGQPNAVRSSRGLRPFPHKEVIAGSNPARTTILAHYLNGREPDCLSGCASSILAWVATLRRRKRI